MSDTKRAIRLVLLAGVDAIALLVLWPDWARLSRDLGGPHAWSDRVGADQAALTLASAALWCVALWLTIGLGAAALTNVPGPAGAAARLVAARLLPAVLLRAVAGVAGLGVLVTPVAAGAHVPARPGPAITAPAPAPSWPTDTRPAPPVQVTWPTNASPPAPTRASPRPAQASHTTPRPRIAPPAGCDHSDQAVPAAPSPPEPRADQDRQTVRVEAGDSLWLIAARRLGPDASDTRIAAEWPRWYAANRPVIGDDPSLVEPGQVLHAPASG